MSNDLASKKMIIKCCGKYRLKILVVLGLLFVLGTFDSDATYIYNNGHREESRSQINILIK